MLTLTDLSLLCLPLCLPSFYLAFRLYRRQFLGTVFNQHIALMLVYSGGMFYICWSRTCCSRSKGFGRKFQFACMERSYFRRSKDAAKGKKCK